MATEQKEVIGLLETVLLRNPVLKLFNTVISKVPLLSNYSSEVAVGSSAAAVVAKYFSRIAF